MTTQKQGLQVKFDEKGEPVAILYRTKDGNWVWYGVISLSEDDQVSLMEKDEKQTITKG